MDDMEKRYAPIAVFVYNRPDKTRRLFESLMKNAPALSSQVHIFSDAAKNEKAKEAVFKVRKYIDTLEDRGCFGKVILHKAEKNKGLAGSVIEGVTDILKSHGRIIVLEDDLILSEHFLDYMNECLDFYEKDKSIWSVSGYSHNPPRPEGYKDEIYLTYRASSWGWGTWLDRWQLVDWEVSDYKSFRLNPVANMSFSRGGNDLPSMLRAQMKGRIDSWAVRWCYSQFKAGMYSIAPVRTLVGNDGLDGSGTNCGPDDEKGYGDLVIDDTKRSWVVPGIEPNRQLIRDFYRKHHLSPYIRIRDKIRQIRGLKG